MGNINCKSKKGHVPKVNVPINRVSRNEQYDWYKVIRGGADDDIIQIAKTSPQMMTTVMFFDIIGEGVKSCNCTCLFENLILSRDEKTKENLIVRLDRAIFHGKCPHVLFRQTGSEDDVFDLSEDQLRAISLQSDICNGNIKPNFIPSPFSFYCIHLAILFKRTNLIKELLPVFHDVSIPLFFFHGSSPWSMPFYLSALSEDEELVTYLNKLCLRTSSDVNSRTGPDILPERMQIAERLAANGTEKALQIFFSLPQTKTNGHFQQAFKGALASKSKYSLDFLCHIGAKINPSTVSSEVQRALKQRDLFTLLYLVQHCKVTIKQELLITAIQTGDKSIMRALLQYLQKTAIPFQGWSLCVIEAVLRNFPSILKQLIVAKFDVNVCFGGISALKWAEILGYECVIHILTEVGGRSFQEYETVSVFNSVLHLNNDLTVPLLKVLITNGFDVNSTADGTPAVFTTMILKRYDLLYMFLINGADPYLTPETWKYFLIRQDENCKQLLLAFVAANFALSADSIKSVIEKLCEYKQGYTGPVAKIDGIRICLNCAHTLTKGDKDILLQHSQSSIGTDTKQDIEDYLFNPKTLQVSCRNSLRKKYGHNFGIFMKKVKQDLPLQFVDFLLCKDVLKRFYSESELQFLSI